MSLRLFRLQKLYRGTARTYEQLTDEVDVKEFFEGKCVVFAPMCFRFMRFMIFNMLYPIEFNMPDTFASWFTIMEMHTHIVSARLMKHEIYGMHARDMLTDAFWNDVQFRARKLGVLNFEIPYFTYF